MRRADMHTDSFTQGPLWSFPPENQFFIFFPLWARTYGKMT